MLRDGLELILAQVSWYIYLFVKLHKMHLHSSNFEVVPMVVLIKACNVTPDCPESADVHFMWSEFQLKNLI